MLRGTGKTGTKSVLLFAMACVIQHDLREKSPHLGKHAIQHLVGQPVPYNMEKPVLAHCSVHS